MKRKFLLIFFIIFFLPFWISSSSVQAEDGWEILEEGAIWYREFLLQDPINHVYVARMLRDAPNTTLETSLGNGNLLPGSEVISSQYSRYNHALSFWDWNADGNYANNWGNRNKVVVAINGGYINDDGSLQSGLIHSSWYAKRFLENQSFSGIAWKNDRSIFIGGLVTHVPNKQMVTFADSDVMYIDGINTARATDQLILYTPQYDKKTPPTAVEQAQENGEIPPEATPLVEVVVQMKQPSLVSKQSEDAEGIVRQVRSNSGSTPLLFDHVVLSASGELASQLQAKVHVGDTIGISQNIKDNSTKDWLGTFAAVQNDFYFLQAGIVVPYMDRPNATTRAPRTAIVFNDRYIFFIVVDGRNPGVSYGMTIQELGQFALTLDDPANGLMEGAALDGGGSSTMVVNGVVKNFPSDGVLNPFVNLQENNTCSKTHPQEPNQYCSLYIPLVQGGVANPAPPATPPIKERPVKNGIMMVMVEGPQFSSKFSPGQKLKTTGNLNMRQGPGTNFGILSSIPSGTQVTVVDHANAVNGVMAKGYHWWLVEYQGNQGWVAENYLTEP